MNVQVLVWICVLLCVCMSCKKELESEASSSAPVEVAATPPLDPATCASDYRVFEGQCVRMTPAQFARHSCPDVARLEACDRLTRAYLVGDGVEADWLRARFLGERICELDPLSEPCRRWHGLNDEKKRAMIQAHATEVAAQRREACQQKDGLSCYNLGRVNKGDGDMTRQYYKMSCRAEFSLGCWAHATMNNDLKDKFTLTRESCAAGLLDACAHEGFALLRGKGVEQDSARAIALLSKACRGGYAFGCAFLGGTYLEGLYDVPEDEEQGIELLKKACDLDDIESCKALNAMPITTRSSFCTMRQGQCLYHPGDSQK